MIINTEVNQKWQSRPMITTGAYGERYIRASAGGAGCALAGYYESAGVEPTDDRPIETLLNFALGLAAEGPLAERIRREGFIPAFGDGGQTTYRVDRVGNTEIPQSIIIEGTADGLYIAPEVNEYDIPEGTLVAFEFKTTNPDSFANLHDVEDGSPTHTLLGYCRQAALHATGCDTNTAVIMVYEMGGKDSRIVRLGPEAVVRHGENAIRRIMEINEGYDRFLANGKTLPDFNKDGSVRRGYCKGCTFRSLCHPDGVAKLTTTDEEEVLPAPQISAQEFAQKLRSVTALKAAQSAINKVVNAESDKIKTFTQAQGYTELSVPVAITDDEGGPLAEETKEFYAQENEAHIRVVTDALKSYVASADGYAHISVKTYPGRVGVGKQHVPSMLAERPSWAQRGKDSTRGTISRKKTPLTRKAMVEAKAGKEQIDSQD